MSKIYDAIHNKQYYRKLFRSWKASELIIDDEKALYQLKNPNSKYEKVCMYRDGCNAFFYGDYGQFSFDNLTWLATPHNLQYDNIGYQMEKLNRESKESLYVFVEENAVNDIIEWAKDRLLNRFPTISEYGIQLIIKYLKGKMKNFYDTYDFIEQHPSLSDAENFIDLVDDMIKSADNGEIEYYSYLNNNYSDLSDYDKMCESDLWKAGKTIHQRFFVNLYAMEVCGQKLTKQKNS